LQYYYLYDTIITGTNLNKISIQKGETKTYE